MNPHRVRCRGWPKWATLIWVVCLFILVNWPIWASDVTPNSAVTYPHGVGNLPLRVAFGGLPCVQQRPLHAREGAERAGGEVKAPPALREGKPVVADGL